MRPSQSHPLQCRCGSLQGYVETQGPANRSLCYCNDCQAFARYLGRPNEILDSNGGTDVIQTLPALVTLTQGQEVLACMRLSDRGLLRWYAKCCNTPIGNTVADFRVSFIGLIHNCLEISGPPLGDSFGPVRMWSFTKHAKTQVKSGALSMLPGIVRILGIILRARITGAYKRTPFFIPGTGLPVVSPKILNAEERQAVYQTVG
jgi:hypothetical protein